jgi:uncharacterized protein
MGIMHITALYAALLAPLFVLLSVRVIQGRRGAAALGDAWGQKPAAAHPRARQLRRVCALCPDPDRACGGFADTALLVHALGLTLLVGRLSHAYGVSQEPETLTFRVTGVALTFAAIGVAAVACFIGAIR